MACVDETYKSLYAGYAPAAAASVYTAPAATTTIVKGIRVSNDSAAVATVTLWRVPSGGAVDDSTIIRATYSVSVGDSSVDPWPIVLETGDALYADSDTASAIALQIDGLEMT